MSGKRHIRYEEMVVTRYHWTGSERVGTLGWDSGTGQLWGTLASQIRERALEARRHGHVTIAGPVPSSFRYRITDPLHKVDQLAAIVASFYYNVPKELAVYYHPPRVGYSFKKSELKRMRARGEDIVH